MVLRRRAPVVVKRTARPSLVGTMARTAVVAGTATAVAGSVGAKQAAAHSQQAQQVANQQQMAELQANQAALASQQAALAAQQAAAQPAAAPAAPAASSMNEKIAQLQQLGELRTMGILSEAEFEVQKAKILAG